MSKDINFEESFIPYLRQGKINGEEITILRNTGSCYDIAPWKLIKPNQLEGSLIWVKQPLINDLRCLLMSDITIEVQGTWIVKTTAAVAEKESDMSYYILGNETKNLINWIKNENPKQFNAAKTGSQVKMKEKL